MGQQKKRMTFRLNKCKDKGNLVLNQSLHHLVCEKSAEFVKCNFRLTTTQKRKNFLFFLDASHFFNLSTSALFSWNGARFDSLKKNQLNKVWRKRKREFFLKIITLHCVT